jgi:hypothetical protein
MTHLQGLTAAVVGTAGLLLGCGADADRPSDADRPPAPLTAGEQRELDTAEARLTQRCLRAHGLSLPRRGEHARPAGGRLQRVLFGDRPGALSVRLPTGHVVTTSDNGCLAEAQRRLYGDRKAWFRADTVVGNLEPLAQQRAQQDPREDALRRARTAVGRRFQAQIDTQRRLARRALERLRSKDL